MADFEEFRRECKGVLAPGARRIHELEAELERSDSEFMAAIRSLDSDFNALSTETSNAIAEIEAILRREVLSADSELKETRKVVDQLHRSRLEELFEKRRDLEENQYLVTFVDMLNRFRQEDQQLRDSLRAGLCGVKEELVLKANSAETKVEELKTRHCIDQHKLEHSVVALNETIATAKAQQRKTRVEMVKLHGLRTALRSQLHKEQSRSTEANKKATNEIQRLYKNYEIFLRKEAEIEKANSAKFARVLHTDQQEIMRLGALLKDRIRLVYREVFSSDWVEPDVPLCDTETVPGKSSYIQSVTSSIRPSFSKPKIKLVLDLIAAHAGFLAANNTGTEIERMQSILSYLEVETAADLDALVATFFEGQEEDDEQLCVEGLDVLEILERFVLEHEERRILDLAAGKRRPGDRSTGPSRKTRERAAREEKKLWDRLGSPVSASEIQCLEQMVPSLESILAQLQRRKILVDRRDALKLELSKPHAC